MWCSKSTWSTHMRIWYVMKYRLSLKLCGIFGTSFLVLRTFFLVWAIVPFLSRKKCLPAHSTVLWEYSKNTLCCVLWWIEHRERHIAWLTGTSSQYCQVPPIPYQNPHSPLWPPFSKFSHSTDVLGWFHLLQTLLITSTLIHALLILLPSFISLWLNTLFHESVPRELLKSAQDGTALRKLLSSPLSSIKVSFIIIKITTFYCLYVHILLHWISLSIFSLTPSLDFSDVPN